MRPPFGPRSLRRLTFAATLLAWGYPLLLHAALYAAWSAAWWTLGRPPRPSLDDPAAIGPAVTLLYPLFGLLLVGFPAAACGGLLLLLLPAWNGRVSWGSAAAFALLFALLWGGAFTLLRYDPLRAVAWYMD